MYIEKSIYIMFVNSGMKVWKREEQFMNNVKVQTKLIIVMLATIVALVLCAVISSESMKQLQSKALETLEADERASYDEQIKQQVDNVISLCQTIYDQYQAGVYTEEEAKKLAADEIRQLRYGDAGYFWVDQYDGTNVVLLGNDTEGTNRMETKDANGYQMVKEIIRVGQEADGGYTDYVEAKKRRFGEESKAITGKSELKPAEKSTEEETQKKGKNWKDGQRQKVKFSFKEQREYETIDEEIAKLEEKIASLDRQIAANATNSVKLRELMEEQEKVREQLEEKEERWMYLNELAEEFGL